MRVRHVHAKPGEYIAIHRNHGGRSSSSGDVMFFLMLAATGLVIWLIVSLWEIILTCLLVVFALCLIWIFRTPLGKAICWSAKHLWILCVGGATQIGKCICFCWAKFKTRRTGTDSQSPSEILSLPAEYNSSSADYGKIIQNRYDFTSRRNFS